MDEKSARESSVSLFSLKDAILQVLQEELKSDPATSGPNPGQEYAKKLIDKLNGSAIELYYAISPNDKLDAVK